jgi:hypothetical protein
MIGAVRGLKRRQPNGEPWRRDWFRVRRWKSRLTLCRSIGLIGVTDAMTAYSSDYKLRSVKASARVEAAVRDWINPELGGLPLVKLTKDRLEKWHQKVADTLSRRRTKVGKAQKNRKADASTEGVRRRRSRC